MKATRTWIVVVIAVVAVLALFTGVVLAGQQPSTRMGDNATELCEQMHESMHEGDTDMNTMRDGGMGGMNGMHQGGMGGMHQGGVGSMGGMSGMHTESTTP